MVLKWRPAGQIRPASKYDPARELKSGPSKNALTWENGNFMRASPEIISRVSHGLTGCVVQQKSILFSPERPGGSDPDSAAQPARADLY